MHRTFRIALASLAGLLVAAGALWADTIKRSPSPLENVTVTKETYKKVVYTLGETNISNEMDRLRDRILGVEYDEWPEGWVEGHEALAASDFQKAFDSFDDVFKAPSSDFPQAKQYGLFMKAETLRLWGESGNDGALKEAATLYNKLLADDPETVHAAKAHIGLGTCLLLQGGKDQALAEFEKVLADEYFTGSDKVAAKVGKAHVTELDKKWAQAIAEYTQILGEAQKEAPETSYLVKVRIATCNVGAGKLPEAQDEFNRILSSSDIPVSIRASVRASALNGRGECGWKNKDYEKAMWDFLRVVILYESVTSESPKAFYLAGQCMRNISRILEKENKKEEARMWKFRAGELEKELQVKFPGSPYSKGG
jgi:tetratricopeptide (TPR) repeat protein